MVAGIREGWFRHYVIPVERVPDIQKDEGPLAVMSPGQIRQCAMRILYQDATVSAEFFHSLTDGYGGTEFLKALLAEYLKLAHGVDCLEDKYTPLVSCPDSLAETTDSYALYAWEDQGAPRSQLSYMPVGERSSDTAPHTTTAIFDADAVLQAARSYHTTLTGFLTAVMAKSVMEIQLRRRTKTQRPVQIMVPVNLRKLFPSKTLRNFSLYALPGIRREDMGLPFERLSAKVTAQLNQQLSSEALHAMLASNHRLQRRFQWLPLSLKCAALRFSFRLFAGKTSSITLSNMGTFTVPPKMYPYIKRVDFLLTPRLYSDYNCGLITFDGRLYINFTRRCVAPELEFCFFEKLCKMNCVPDLEVDGVSISHQNIYDYLGKDVPI